ncbi:hypothetical protein [Bacillus sp. OAE603]|uniref:hypothetical protein n=1 Tax=Gottfriedia sp. OAE603 TaxID=2663872 RepID=UPI00178A7441
MIFLLIIVGTLLVYLLSNLPEYASAMILLGGVLSTLIGIYIELIIIEKKLKATLS